MDGERGYADDQESRWQAERGYDARYDEGAGYPDGYGVPQPRGRSGSTYGGEAGRHQGGHQAAHPHQGEARPAAYFSGPEAPSGALPTRGAAAVTGPATTRDPLFSPDEAARFRAAAEEPMGHAMGQPAPRRQAERPPTDRVYRARRPGAMGLVGAVTVVVGLLLVRALAVTAFGDPYQPGGVLGSALALGALPLAAIGLYGLITGAAHHAEQVGWRVWARPPLAYLLVGLVLLIAAGLAIS